MKTTSTIRFIGTVSVDQNGGRLTVYPEYREALHGLDAFSHAIVLWWAHACSTDEDRNLRICRKPYKQCAEDVGVFGSRSPARPNPIGLSVISLGAFDLESGTVETPYIDTLSGTPIVDLKPYFPSLDRSESATVPAWCRHWPSSIDASAAFDWSAEFE